MAAVAVLLGAAGPAEAAFPGKNGAIAFMSDRYGGGAQIYGMNADGSGERRLTDAVERPTNPQWSANGRKLLFENCAGPDPEFCNSEIYGMNADGSKEVRLNGSGGVTKPS